MAQIFLLGLVNSATSFPRDAYIATERELVGGTSEISNIVTLQDICTGRIKSTVYLAPLQKTQVFCHIRPWRSLV